KHHQVANLPNYLIRYTMSSGGISQSKRQQQLSSRLKVQWHHRDFGNVHFYAGILKTAALWFMPVTLITSIKQILGGYKKR
ncbi:MAG TPA: hypothetical protein VFR09_02930, partial [Alphaproteobacteria bacterium]|nr:hypothetical protein [Alphaproteobacteria bacterium]